MTDNSHHLNFTDPTKGFFHFALYSEPSNGIACAALNADVAIERNSIYVAQWRERLRKCTPNALHATLVTTESVPQLFGPCAEEGHAANAMFDCHDSYVDPLFGLPVVVRHTRNARSGRETWACSTYAPLDLRPDDQFERLIIDRESNTFWARTTDGVLSLLPEAQGRGYNVGYGGGGPIELARYITQLLDTGGKETAAGGTPFTEKPNAQILKWATSDLPARDREWTLRKLRTLL